MAGIFLLLASSSANAAIPQIPQSETLQSLVIMADREHAVPLSLLASDYSRQRHMSVATAFHAPERILATIADGEQCDLYLTSYPGMTEILKSRGLIDVYATTKLRKEQLVLVAARGWWKTVAPKNWKTPLTRTSQLPSLLRALGDFQLLIGEPNHVASGRYATEILQKQRWYVPLTSRINYTSGTAATVQRLHQPGMVGILYRSDLENQPELEEIAHFSEKISPEIWLVGNVVAGERMVQARNLLQHLKQKLQ